MSVQKQQLFKHFKTTNGSFSVISQYIFKETYIFIRLAISCLVERSLFQLCILKYQ